MLKREFDPSKMAEWEAWVDSRPAVVADLARHFPPWEEYTMGDGVDYYVPYSYEEDGTLTVTRVSGGLLFAPEGEPLYNVFGVKPGDLFPRQKGEA